MPILVEFNAQVKPLVMAIVEFGPFCGMRGGYMACDFEADGAIGRAHPGTWCDTADGCRHWTERMWRPVEIVGTVRIVEPQERY